MTESEEILERLDEIERRADAATAGPWQAFVEGRDHLSGDDFVRTGGIDDQSPDMYVTLSMSGPPIPAGSNDLDFIAHARQDVPALVNALRTASRREHSHHAVGIDRSLPTVEISLWRSDAIVLFDWLMSADLNQIQSIGPAQRQALVDLLARLEIDTDIPYGSSGSGLSQEEIDAASADVAKDMGW